MDWDKGAALAHLLQALQLDDGTDVLPIYIGDDRTDEDAFEVLRKRALGFGILVSTKVRAPPRRPVDLLPNIILQSFSVL